MNHAGIWRQVAGIMPMHGITSRTPLYQLADTPTRPLSPFLYKTWDAAQREARVAPKPILEARDINRL